MFGTFTSGSTAVTGVQRGDTYGGNAADYVNAGDQIWAYGYGDTYFQWPYEVNGTIASITNGSPGSATLSANALVSGRFPILPLPVN
jgi:hypothetical protein